MPRIEFNLHEGQSTAVASACAACAASMLAPAKVVEVLQAVTRSGVGLEARQHRRLVAARLFVQRRHDVCQLFQ